MKLVLFADNSVGQRIFDFLIKNYPEDLSLVVTIAKNKIYQKALQSVVPVCVFDTQYNVISKFPEDVDLGVLAWWPKIIKSPLLEVPKLGFINTHPSLLPYNRGKHYNFWALVEQTPFGVTLHRVDSGVDTGEIIAQREIHYGWTDDGKSLYMKAQTEMVLMFCDIYPTLREGYIHSTPQEKGVGSFHHSSELEKASHIDLEQMYQGRDILNLLRARTFEGHPGCWFEDNGNRYEISIKIRKIKK